MKQTKHGDALFCNHVLNALDDVVIVVNEHSEIEGINDTGLTYFNKTRSAIIGGNISNLFKRPCEYVDVQKLIKTITNGNEIIRECYDQGRDQYLQIKIKPIPKSTKGSCKYLIIIKDITLNHKAKQSEEKYKILVENQGEGIGMTDENEVFVFANPVAEEIFGVERGGLIHRSVFEFVSKETREIIKDQTAQRKLGKKGSYEIEIMRPDGKKRTILITATPRYDENGLFLNSFGIFRDTTKQKQAEQELVKHQQLLKSGLAYQEVISGIALSFNIISDFDKKMNDALKIVGNLLSVSRVYVFENSPDGETMTNTFEWCNDSITPQKDQLKEIPYSTIPSLKKILLEKGIIFSENTDELPEDMVRVLEPQDIISIIVFPIYVGTGFFGFIGFDECKKQRKWTKAEVELLRTISGIIANAFERRIMETNLKHAKEKAEESDRLKSAFLANMSHEIRTPMNGIIGFSDLLINPNLHDEQRNYYAKIVSDSSRQLLSIVNDILELSRIETRQVQIKSDKFSLNGLIMELFRYYKPKTEDRNISLLPVKGLDDNGSMVYGDRTKLYIILQHLLANAFKFTNKGYIKFGYERKDKNIRFFVKDTGIGVSKESHRLIFEPFRQADMEATREFGGTGLGLSISQKLVQLLGGKIGVESDLGKGAEFFFTVLYAPVEERRADNVKSQADMMEFQDMKVLVAEDEEINYIYFEELLTDWGIQVIHARNGREAVDLCKEEAGIDLVFMDIKMPLINGLEATKEIKAFNPNLVIVAQTAYAMLEDREKALNAGCDDYITKPIDKDRLLLLIKKYKIGEYK